MKNTGKSRPDSRRLKRQTKLEKKLTASKSYWHKTIGEYLTIFTGIILSVVAVLIGFYYSNTQVKEIFDTDADYHIKYDTGVTRKPVNFIYLNENESYVARVKVLSEAVSSYQGSVVKELREEYDSADFFVGEHVAVVLGDSVIDNPDGLRLLLESLIIKNTPILWLGGGFDYVSDIFGIPLAGDGEISITPPKADLEYKDSAISGSGLPFNRYDMQDGEVLANIKLHDTFERPAIVRYDNVILSAFTPFSNNYAPLALAVVMDTLSLFVGEHKKAPKIIFRLEDINGYSHGKDDTSFRKTIDFLMDRKLYVHMGIIPSMFDENGSFIANIDAAIPVLEAVNTYRDKIGIIQHGYKHFRDDPRNIGLGSGEAYEYFADDDETMGIDGAQEFARNTIRKGYKLMVKSGLKPKMFEAPHYMMSKSQYKIAEQMYDLIQHPYYPNVYAYGVGEIILPWMTRRNDAIYVPSSAGYVEGSNPESVNEILDLLELVAGILPDPMFVVFFHPYIIESEGREQDLTMLVQGMDEAGYQIVNMMDQVVPVTTGSVRN